MTIYEIPSRELPLRQRHSMEQMQVKIRQGVDGVDVDGQTFAASLTPASVAGYSVADEAFAVSGVTVGMVLAIVGQPSTDPRVLAYAATVTGANEITVSFGNSRSTAATPTAGTYTFRQIT